jgi:hypothetical protein
LEQTPDMGFGKQHQQILLVYENTPAVYCLLESVKDEQSYITHYFDELLKRIIIVMRIEDDWVWNCFIEGKYSEMYPINRFHVNHLFFLKKFKTNYQKSELKYDLDLERYNDNIHILTKSKVYQQRLTKELGVPFEVFDTREFLTPPTDIEEIFIYNQQSHHGEKV